MPRRIVKYEPEVVELRKRIEISLKMAEELILKDDLLYPGMAYTEDVIKFIRQLIKIREQLSRINTRPAGGGEQKQC